MQITRQLITKSTLCKLIMGTFLMSTIVSNATAITMNFDNLECEQETIRKGWNVLTEDKVFFGHQSVGNNIVAGLEQWAKKCNKEIFVVDSRDPDKIINPMLIHSKIGRNMQPETKIADFVGVMNQGVGDKVDIAFMKFCYIDIQKDTDIEALFTQYNDAMRSLSARYPNSKFLAVTVPLTTLKKGINVWVKNALDGQLSGVSGLLENKKRQQFNERLRSEFNTQNGLFDLAEIESTLPDGSREKYTLDGKEYYSLYKGYTNDGGHLNEKGQLRVAQSLLYYLGKTVQ